MAQNIDNRKRRKSSKSAADAEADRRRTQARQEALERSRRAREHLGEDERQVLEWLDSPSEELRPEVMDALAEEGDEDVAGRFGRGLYRGRRSSEGPEKSHGQPDQWHAAMEEVDDERLAKLNSPGYSKSKDVKKQARKAQARRERARRKKERHPVKRTIKVLLVCIVVLVGVWLGYLNHNMQLHDDELNEALTGVSSPIEPYYVLICGSDSRGEDGEAARADTIILGRIDAVNKTITLVSIPRDTRVDLGGDIGYSKINAAYSYGGPAGLVNAVSEFAGVPIAHFFEVEFDGFEELVDAVGGVTVDVPPNTTVEDVTVPEGIQTLNGEQALIFVRCRKTYALGDFQRAANQRAFIIALSDAIRDASWWRYPFIITAASKAISTDRNVFGMMWMMIEVMRVDSSNIMSGMAPSTTETIDGVSYVISDEEAWAQMIKRVNSGLSPSE